MARRRDRGRLGRGVAAGQHLVPDLLKVQAAQQHQHQHNDDERGGEHHAGDPEQDVAMMPKIVIAGGKFIIRFWGNGMTRLPWSCCTATSTPSVHKPVPVSCPKRAHLPATLSHVRTAAFHDKLATQPSLRLWPNQTRIRR